MQFTVLIEFLIPGLATVLLGIALIPNDLIPHLPQGLSGDAAMALVLLAVSYPVGHLVNFPIFWFVQQRLLGPRIRKSTLHEYLATGVDLAAIATRELGFRVGADTEEEIRKLFNYMQALVFSKNIDHFNSYDLFFKSLQRLARGMLFPIFLAALFILKHKDASLSSLLIVAVLLLAFLICLWLLIYFIRAEVEEISRFFVTLTSRRQDVEERPTPGIDRTVPLRGDAS